ncbi:MAG TPA: cytochrome c [Anaeromyxobacteraceae bacterium]|nr:cytochrome c [Anaeromyxobacteraceae bacterium]
MSERAAKLIFWSGTLSSLALFLALTWDTHRSFDALTHADRLSPGVVEGKRVFEKYNCNDCHTILGFGGYYAPDLTRAHARLGEDAIRLRLQSPEKVFASSWRKMPQQNLQPAEIDRMVEFLRWVSDIENNDWPPQDSQARWKASTRRLLAGAALSPGAALVNQESCLACHSLGGKGGDRGPRLEYVATRRDADWIARYLADPEAVTPGAAMPKFDKLSEAQRRAIAEFVVSLAARREP